MIIWLDDDTDSSLAGFTSELYQGGYSFKRFRNPDDLFLFLSNENVPFQLFISDIMLPTGKTLATKPTKFGSITGLLVFDELKKYPFYETIPKLIFSINTNADVISYAEQNKICWLSKLEAGDGDFLAKVHTLISNNEGINGK